MKQLVVIYPGRFQPFCKHHKAIFDEVSEKFGRQNVYICTSDVTDSNRSPFTFADKKTLASKTGVDDRMFKVSGNLYSPKNVVPQIGLSMDGEIAVIYVVGEKDMDPNSSRITLLSTKNEDTGEDYFKPYTPDQQLESPDRVCYLYVVKNVYIMMPDGSEMSGATVRSYLKDAKVKGVDPKDFELVFGWYDKKYVPYILSFVS
jgi:hypothetical protein